MTGKGNYMRTVHGFGNMFKKTRKNLVPCPNSRTGRHTWNYGSVCFNCGKDKNQVSRELRQTKKELKEKYPDGIPKESGWGWTTILWLLVFWVFVMAVTR